MKKQLAVLGIAAIVALSGCGNSGNDGNNGNGTTNMNTPGGTNNTNGTNTNNTQNNNAQSGNAGDHAGMNHSGSGEMAKVLKQAANPTYKVGSKVIINADHMPGMKDAEATVAGAFDTTAYTVSYTPTTGGDPVSDHKWVIHEELKDAASTPYEPGAEVVIDADHMEGMMGAKATIDSAEQTTVYMLNYTPVGGGELVKNHMWVTEDEISTKSN
ncbi:YdhK family protein [Paenibacillus donghaensis]|uniref:DUF1541 domain-containing protein n=1 Tax=Paenibacillus donghaensis TaxID=414771 RepID=A0A2Z2KPJ4_9BACL|nr:YdhK family protein [Paenibacillus donghaensis]ASA23232.1 hypothetical protein B9T62_21935 [Paenibacillus donghaensis]